MGLDSFYNKTSFNGWMGTPLEAMSIGIAVPVFSLLFSLGIILKRVINTSPGEGKQVEVSNNIKEGAIAYMKRQYMVIFVFVVIFLGLILAVIQEPADPFLGNSNGLTTTPYWKMAVHFFVGAFMSSLSGIIGLHTAIRANVRTCNACNSKESPLNKGLRVAFDSGCVMGLCVVSFVCLGEAVMFVIFEDPMALAGFGFGGSLVALFARVGGGIYTKAADVGSDLVGKIEAGIPEDDPRNPGVIADNVGDNVGDVAGLGADLFESYAGTIVAAIPLGFRAYGIAGIALPIWLSASGIICSLLGTFFVQTGEKVRQDSLLWALRRGIFMAVGFLVLSNVPICLYIFEYEMTIGLELYICNILGLVAGVIVGLWTEISTSSAYLPTRSIVKMTLSGPATVIIQGLAVGMASNVIPVFVLGAAIICCYTMQGAFGVSIASVGMLSTLGITLATDAYGPVADNAGGIAEMAELPPDVRRRTDALDSLGNTTAATGKGFAISSALMTTLALILEFTETAPHDLPEVELAGAVENCSVVHGDTHLSLDLTEAYVLVGALVGSLLPFLFSALTMFAVGTTADKLIHEIRRQFREIPGLLDGKEGVKADYAKCVDMCTKAALTEMTLPAVIAVFSPIVFGYMFGSKFLGGVLAGTILSGFMLAVMMANAGGAWDNAKKYVEAGSLGKDHAKGSQEHHAAIIGDTVGDPFKDTSGPSLDILAKLMSMISLVLSGTLDPGFKNFYKGLILLGILLFVGLITLWYCYLKNKKIPSEFKKLRDLGTKEIELEEIEYQKRMTSSVEEVTSSVEEVKNDSSEQLEAKVTSQKLLESSA